MTHPLPTRVCFAPAPAHSPFHCRLPLTLLAVGEPFPICPHHSLHFVPRLRFHDHSPLAPTFFHPCPPCFHPPLATPFPANALSFSHQPPPPAIRCFVLRSLNGFPDCLHPHAPHFVYYWGAAALACFALLSTEKATRLVSYCLSHSFPPHSIRSNVSCSNARSLEQKNGPIRPGKIPAPLDWHALVGSLLVGQKWAAAGRLTTA